MRPDVPAKRRAFAALHRSGCFVIPNPWDAGSARYLQSLGFQALATTSAGFAWSHARPDNGVTRDMALAHLHEMVAAVDVPINADFENGFAPDAAGVAENVRRAVTTGVAGLSIEDSTGDAARPLFTLDEAVQRIRAARSAIDRAGGGVMLVGRAECFLVGRPDLTETIARLQAYANAGADCLYAPGVTTRERIVALVEAVAPKPLNLLVGTASELTVATSPRWACGASASAARWRVRPGAASCARRSCWRSRGASTASRTRRRARSSTRCSASRRWARREVGVRNRQWVSTRPPRQTLGRGWSIRGGSATVSPWRPQLYETARSACSFFPARSRASMFMSRIRTARRSSGSRPPFTSRPQRD